MATGVTRYIARMLIEVHSREKPAVTRRALLSAVALLALATALAATMAWSRTGEPPASRIEPPGWSISFLPPGRFHGLRSGLSTLEPVLVFGVRSATGVEAELDVHHLLRPVTVTPREVCDRVLRAYAVPPPHDRGMLPLTWFDKKLGAHDAAEVWDPQVGIVVRAMVLANGEAYAVALVAGASIDPETYRLFERTCGSIERRVRQWSHGVPTHQ